MDLYLCIFKLIYCFPQLICLSKEVMCLIQLMMKGETTLLFQLAMFQVTSIGMRKTCLRFQFLFLQLNHQMRIDLYPRVQWTKWIPQEVRF